MLRVIERVREKCNMDTSGGRVNIASMHECFVYDVAEFSEATQAALRAEFPRLLIDILSDPSSLSGFVIRMRLQTSHHQRVVVTAALLACMAAIVAHSLA